MALPAVRPLAEIASYGAGSLNCFIGHNIASASTAKTDGCDGYAAVPVEPREPHVIGAMGAHVMLPRIHQVFSNLKGWVRGVYHGVCAKHLQSYLDDAKTIVIAQTNVIAWVITMGPTPTCPREHHRFSTVAPGHSWPISK